MGVRTRGLDIKAGAMRNAADKTARAEAEAVIQRWNDQLALGRDMLWSPTTPAAGRVAQSICGPSTASACVGHSTLVLVLCSYWARDDDSRSWRLLPRNDPASREFSGGGHLERSQSMSRAAFFAALACAIAVLPASYANAQSPNPATIAPGSSGAGLAPATPAAPSPQPRSTIPDPAPGGNTVQAPSGIAPASPLTQGAPSTSGSGSRSPSRK